MSEALEIGPLNKVARETKAHMAAREMQSPTTHPPTPRGQGESECPGEAVGLCGTHVALGKPPLALKRSHRQRAAQHPCGSSRPCWALLGSQTPLGRDGSLPPNVPHPLAVRSPAKPRWFCSPETDKRFCQSHFPTRSRSILSGTP